MKRNAAGVEERLRVLIDENDALRKDRNDLAFALRKAGVPWRDRILAESCTSQIFVDPLRDQADESNSLAEALDVISFLRSRVRGNEREIQSVVLENEWLKSMLKQLDDRVCEYDANQAGFREYAALRDKLKCLTTELESLRAERSQLLEIASRASQNVNVDEWEEEKARLEAEIGRLRLVVDDKEEKCVSAMRKLSCANKRISELEARPMIDVHNDMSEATLVEIPVGLSGGENVLEIVIERVLIENSVESVVLPFPALLLVCFDFFEYPTQISTPRELSVVVNDDYLCGSYQVDFHRSFFIDLDDSFFRSYLATQKLELDLYVARGLEAEKIGICRVSFRSLLAGRGQDRQVTVIRRDSSMDALSIGHIEYRMMLRSFGSTESD